MIFPSFSAAAAASGSAIGNAQHIPGAKHLVVDISAHGFGHLAQAAAVINALEDHRQMSAPHEDINLTIRSVADVNTLRERIKRPFHLIPYRQDSGMIMYDALHVDPDATMEYYADFHGNYNKRMSDAAQDLEALQPDLVFSDVPYLGLDAAKLVGVPSVALCSLNWGDVFQAYCGNYRGSAKICDEIQNAYSNADVFLTPTPSMPMSVDNTRPISPIAFLGDGNKSRELRLIAGLEETDECVRFVLIGVGGVGINNLPLNTWPRLDGVQWIFPDGVLSKNSDGNRSDFYRQSQFSKFRYIDLLASVDLVVTKTGYGTQAEAVLNQVPSICIERLDWPEHEHLRKWHEEHGEVDFIAFAQLGTNRFVDMVCSLLDRPWSRPSIEATGPQEAATTLNEYF